MTSTVMDPERRAALVAAARGERRPAGPVAQGVRVVTPAADPVDPAPAADAPAGGEVDGLLARAESSSRPRVRALAARIRELLAELEGRSATVAQEIEAEQRVVRLRQLLAEAEQRLRTVRRGEVSSRPAAPARPALTGGEARAARRWALANGVACNASGKVPNRVIDAWRAATAAGDGGGPR